MMPIIIKAKALNPKTLKINPEIMNLPKLFFCRAVKVGKWS
jgi:hypothetical protein